MARHHLPSIGVLLLGLSISLLMAWTDIQGQRQHNLQLMKRHALVYSNAIQRALEHGQAVVEDLRALFNASASISRREFDIFGQSQLKFQSSIQALEWLPKVQAAERALFEQRARRHYPDFQFTDLDQQGRLLPAPQRPVYFPVYYLTPYHGNEQALGYTASRSTPRNIAMEQALATASTVSSTRIRLLQEQQQQFALLLIAPVFTTLTPPADLAPRRDALRGYVMAIFRINDLVETALANQDQHPLMMTLSDLSAQPGQQFLYHFPGGTPLPGGATNNSLPPITEIWRQLGHEWQLQFSPRAGAYAIDWRDSLLLLTVGILLTLVIAYPVHRWCHQQFRQQQRLAREKQRSEHTLQQKDLTLMRQNRALTQLTGNPRLLQQQLNESLSDITCVAADTLSVARASIWLLSDDHQLIRCVDLYELTLRHHSSGVELRREAYPRYFDALLNEHSIIANDAYLDSRTSEFASSYLSVIGITAMLDVPIRRHGKVVGVLCCEHVGAPRQWSTDEEHFCHSIANIVSLAMESIERRQAEQRLQESTARLAMINAIATHVTAGMNVNQVIGITLDRLSERFPSLRVNYATITKAGIRTVRESRAPDPMPDTRGRQCDLAQTPEYLALLRQRQSMVVTNVQHDNRLAPLAKKLAASRTRAMLEAPLWHDRGLVGLLSLEYHLNHFWTENELLTLQETAEYLEFAIREAWGQEAREKAEHALEKHKANLEQLVQQRTRQLEYQAEFERLVASLSTRFIKLPAEQLDDAISEALGQLGEFAQVDRCNLCHWRKPKNRPSTDLEWHRNGTTSLLNDGAAKELADISWMQGQLRQKKPVHFADPDELPDEAAAEKAWCQAHQIRSLCVIPLNYGTRLFGTLTFSTQRKSHDWTENDVILLKLIGEMLVNAFERKQYEQALKKSEKLLLESNKVLEDLVTIDALTGIANRRFFELRYLSDFQRATRDSHAIALIFFDIDYFKHYNDHFGHPKGDRCLREVATTLGKNFQRATEAVVRYGGEEFVAILTNISREEAAQAAERARQAVEKRHIEQGPQCPVRCVTVSCGVAWQVPDKNDKPDGLVNAADSALYRAKQAGRNCVRGAE